MSSNLNLSYKPTGYSYRVAPNVWAGEYPVWDWDSRAGMRQLRLFLDFGINAFVDLTESGEMPPYAEHLPPNITRFACPIPNREVPQTIEIVENLFKQIQVLFAEKPTTNLYIHCLGGVGRTGTIVACYYIYFEHLSFEEALEKMRTHYAYHERSMWIDSPETQQQIDFIKAFSEKISHSNDRF